MLTFMFVVLVLFLIPGPAVFLTISQSIKGGKRAGIITGVGIAAGDLIHTLAAVLGLSAILMTSALAFEVVKYLGAAYLIYLGVSILLEKAKSEKRIGEHQPVVKTVNLMAAFRQALFIELLNPKTALFFLAFLPQFVRSDGLPIVYQLLTLGLTFVIMSIMYTTMLALLASSIGNRILAKSNGKTSPWLNRVVALIYIGLGLHLVFEHK